MERKPIFQILTGVLIQLAITPFLLFMVFGFFASFEHRYWNIGHLIYATLYVLLAYFFIIAAKQRWHRYISIGLIVLLTLFDFVYTIQIVNHW